MEVAGTEGERIRESDKMKSGDRLRKKIDRQSLR